MGTLAYLTVTLFMYLCPQWHLKTSGIFHKLKSVIGIICCINEIKKLI